MEEHSRSPGSFRANHLLRLRELGSSAVRSLPGTSSAESVFWSPDGRSLGFVSRGKLQRIDVATGSIEALADAETGRGGAWSARGDILFAQKAAGAIYRVAASGGPVTAATALEKGDILHRWPQFLPDGKALSLLRQDGQPRDDRHVPRPRSVKRAGRKLVLRNGATGVFVPPATLLYGRGSALLAQHFDPETGELSGAPVTVVRPVMRAELGSFIDLFTVSQTGVLVYRAGSAERQLTWMDRKGNVLGKLGQPDVIWSVTLSPDDREAAISVRTIETGAYTSSLIDIARNVSTPLVESAAHARVDARRTHRRLSAVRGRSTRSGGEPSTAIRRTNRPASSTASRRRTPLSPGWALRALHAYGRQLRHRGQGPSGRRETRDASSQRIRRAHAALFPRRTLVRVQLGRARPDRDLRAPVPDHARRRGASRPRGASSRPGAGTARRSSSCLSTAGSWRRPFRTAGTTLSIGTPQALFRSPVRLNSVVNQYAVSADGQRFLLPAHRDFDASPSGCFSTGRRSRRNKGAPHPNSPVGRGGGSSRSLLPRGFPLPPTGERGRVRGAPSATAGTRRVSARYSDIQTTSPLASTGRERQG